MGRDPIYWKPNSQALGEHNWESFHEKGTLWIQTGWKLAKNRFAAIFRKGKGCLLNSYCVHKVEKMNRLCPVKLDVFFSMRVCHELRRIYLFFTTCELVTHLCIDCVRIGFKRWFHSSSFHTSPVDRVEPGVDFYLGKVFLDFRIFI